MRENNKIAIIGSSSAGLPPEIRNKKDEGYFDVPFQIIINDEMAFLDTPNISDAENQMFVNALKDKKNTVATAQPSQQDYYQALQEAKEWGAEEIIVPSLISSKLSGAVNSLGAAINRFEEEHGNSPKIILPDRFTKVSMAEGLDILKAIRLRELGKSAIQIMDIINEEYFDCGVAQVFTSFEQLRRNGRIGRAQSLAAGIFNVKGIVGLDLEDGVLDKIGQTRKWKEAYSIAVNHVANKVGPSAVRLVIPYFETEQQHIDNIRELAHTKLNVVEELPPVEQSKVISAHTDTGTFAIIAEKVSG